MHTEGVTLLLNDRLQGDSVVIIAVYNQYVLFCIEKKNINILS